MGEGASIACLGNSFTPDTPVLMADRTSKPIANIRVGEEILATDPETGKTTAKAVTALIVDAGIDFTDVIIGTATGDTATIHTTPHHPFWSPDRHQWVDAADLKPGDKLAASTPRAPSTVDRISTFTGHQKMHNLTVADIHTYYVLAGNTPILVHNSNCIPDLGAAWKAKPAAEVCGNGGCERVADRIQSVIGGDVMRITDRYGAPFLGKYRGVDSGWGYHDVVVKDGRVFDATTGRHGELMADYRAAWEFGDDLVINPAPR